MIAEWFVILTIGCLPIEEQPPDVICVVETKVAEIRVFDEEIAKHIADTLPARITVAVPGSFVIARHEKRFAKEKKEESK